MKSVKRAKARAKKLAAKKAAMMKPGFKSKYATKRALQVRGIYAPTSPFVASDHPDAAPRWHDEWIADDYER